MMQQLAYGLMAIGLIVGTTRYLDDLENKRVTSYRTEMAKKSVDSFVLNSQKHLPIMFSPFRMPFKNTHLIKVEKVNELMIKQTLEIDKGYNESKSGMLKDLVYIFTSNICRDKTLLIYINVGMVHRYEIQRSNGEYVGTFDIDEQVCTSYTTYTG